MRTRVELYRDGDYRHRAYAGTYDGGKWRWRYLAANGRILADSGQGYKRRIDCLGGCATVLGGQWQAIKDPESYDGFVGWIRRTIHNDWAVPLTAPEHEGIPVVDLTQKAKP